MKPAKIIRPIKSNTLPSQVLLFDVIYTTEKHSISDRILNPIPVLIGYKKWRVRNGRKVYERSGWLQPGFDFWRELRRLATPGTSTLTMSCSAYVDYTKLGFWQLLLNGYLASGEIDGERAEEDESKQSRRWKPLYVTEDSPTVLAFRFQGNSGTVVAIDPRNYSSGFRPSFDKSSESFSMDGATDFLESDKEQYRARRRIERMEAFYDKLSRWLADNQLGSLRYTFSAQAFSAFRRRFIPKQFECHRDREALQLERASYVGGRCECKRIGVINGPVYQFDFNSAYPYVAFHYPLPIGLRAYLARGSIDDLCGLGIDQDAIARVTIESDVPNYPLRTKDRVIYPVGKFTTTLAGPELAIALGSGHISKVHEITIYEMGNPLVDFYAFWKDCKDTTSRETHPEFYSFLKQFGNGLIGKLAQKSKAWVVQPDEAAERPFECWWGLNPETGQLTVFRSFAGEVSYLTDKGESPNSIPAIASFVTSWQRVRLLQAINTCGAENVYYYDTDSVWTNDAGFRRLYDSDLLDNGEWGKLKTVAAYNKVEFRGIKHYTADDVIRCSGQPRLRIQIGHCDAERYEIRKVMSDLWAKKTPFADIVESKVRRAGPYHHGKVERDGTVNPFRLEE